MGRGGAPRQTQNTLIAEVRDQRLSSHLRGQAGVAEPFLTIPALRSVVICAAVAVAAKVNRRGGAGRPRQSEALPNRPRT
jgi:hypothetical protein